MIKKLILALILLVITTTLYLHLTTHTSTNGDVLGIRRDKDGVIEQCYMGELNCYESIDPEE